MDQMAQGGPPGMAAAIAQYRKVYGPVLDGIAQADGIAGLKAAVASADRAAIDAATNDIFPVITELCT